VKNHHSGALSGAESSTDSLTSQNRATRVIDRGLGTFPAGLEGHGVGGGGGGGVEGWVRYWQDAPVRRIEAEEMKRRKWWKCPETVTHRIKGTEGRARVPTQARRLFIPRHHGPGHRSAAKLGQAPMSWASPYWAGSGRHGPNLDLFSSSFVIFSLICFCFFL
jgi:hypothetical protein